MRKDAGDPAMMWWAPVTPCTSIYLPVYVAAGGVPSLLSDAGKTDTSGMLTALTEIPQFCSSNLPTLGRSAA